MKSSRIIKSTIENLLLSQIDVSGSRGSPVETGLQNGGRGEADARSASALVLDRGNDALSPGVESGGEAAVVVQVGVEEGGGTVAFSVVGRLVDQTQTAT